MGKSAKFYKKPSLKEKQTATGKSRSTLSAVAPTAKDAVMKKAAVSGKAVEKRQQLQEKTRQKEEATRAPKPVFRAAGAQTTSEQADEPVDENEDDDHDMDHTETLKRRPRNKQRKDWGPMPKDVGIDYLRQWDSRS